MKYMDIYYFPYVVLHAGGNDGTKSLWAIRLHKLHRDLALNL